MKTITKAYVLFGLPASGKTTLAKHIALSTYAIRHSYDDLQKNVSVKTFFQNITSDIEAGNDVVIDAMIVDKYQRLALLRTIEQYDCKKLCVVLPCDLEEITRRNALRKNERVSDDVFADLITRYAVPTLDEGWDEIIYVKEDGNYEKHFTGD